MSYIAERRSTTFATSAALADVDAFKTAAATPTSAVTYSGADLDGALANPGPVTDAMMRVARFPSVTSSAQASTYNTTDAIVLTGTRGGVTATVSLLLTAAGGDETIIGTDPLDTLTSIYVPAQLGGSGALAFGFSGVACPLRRGIFRPMPFIPLGAGSVRIGWHDGVSDTLAVLQNVDPHVSPFRIYADTTDVGVTVLD